VSNIFLYISINLYFKYINLTSLAEEETSNKVLISSLKSKLILLLINMSVLFCLSLVSLKFLYNFTILIDLSKNLI